MSAYSSKDKKILTLDFFFYFHFPFALSFEFFGTQLMAFFSLTIILHVVGL